MTYRDFSLLDDRPNGFDSILFFDEISPFLPSRFRARVKALAPQPQHDNGDYYKSKSLSFPLDTDKQPYPTYGNHPDFIAGYNSKKGDISEILSLTALGQTVDSIKSGIEGIEKALNEYEQTGSLSGAAWAGSTLALEKLVERKFKVGRRLNVVENVKKKNKGLGNPFKNKSAKDIDEMFIQKGFERKGIDPVNGTGGYVNPKTNRSYHIDPIEWGKFQEPNHVDINRLRSYTGTLSKKKLSYKSNGK